MSSTRNRQSRRTRLWQGLRTGSWVLAAFAVWGAIVSRRVFELPDTLTRALFIVVLLVLLLCLSALAIQRWSRSSLRFAPLVFFFVCGIAEWRAVIRHRSLLASAPDTSVGPVESVWHPLTTTDVVERYYTLPTPRLKLDRLRVTVLTDIHLSPALPAAYFEQVLTLVRREQPDLIVLTGDYASTSRAQLLFGERFGAGSLHARFGIFAVLGNHEYWVDAPRARALLATLGATLVSGQCAHLPEAVGPVAVCGSDAPWGTELTGPLDARDLNLVLSHTPDNVYRLAEQGASVVFSGHTHGGQIRFPWLGPLVVPSRYGRRFDEGHFRVAGVDLFVSTGVGVGSPAFRLYCPPEILVVDLTRTGGPR